MNKKILFAEVILALVIVLGFKIASEKRPGTATKSKVINLQQVYKNRMAIGCSPDWNILDADSLGNAMKPLPGWGNYRWDIKTSSDSARFYFNQGINMYYAFHIIESLASFKKAATFDSANAMIYWAQALAYGPNINDFAYAATPDALLVTQKAMRFSVNNNAKEKALIQAMSVRYNADSTIARSDLNELYAAAMLKVWKQFEQDPDISALYADARMLQHPWEYWKNNGEAQPWTPEILSVIENALKIAPQHPGLNHYNIHMREASPDPARALASAQRLETMMPDVSHMVHMPSHIYIRTGRYQTGINVNDMSIHGYNKYLALYPDVVNNIPLYVIHNLHMKAACAMLMPGYSKALEAAEQCAASFDTSFLSMAQPVGNFIQYVYVTPLITKVQYAKWNELLSMPDYPGRFAFAYAFSKWSKGLAYAATGKTEEAKKELAALRTAMKHPDLAVLNYPFNKPVDQMVVGERMLSGFIAQQENKISDAIGLLKEAITAEDNLIYQEPRDWLNPSRLFLANIYIRGSKPAEAEKILKEELVINPHNYHALSKLRGIYSNQKSKAAELKKIDAEIKGFYPGVAF